MITVDAQIEYSLSIYEIHEKSARIYVSRMEIFATSDGIDITPYENKCAVATSGVLKIMTDTLTKCINEDVLTTLCCKAFPNMILGKHKRIEYIYP
jgi:hypothetical protein